MSDSGLSVLRAMVEDITSKPQYGEDVVSKMILARMISRAIERTLATQPDPVPELPHYMKHCENGWHYIEFANGCSYLMNADRDPDDLDRIAEAARILAARERARRAGR